MRTLATLKDDFSLLDDWEDRYRYLIELGRALPEMPAHLKTEANKVRGCASQVWLATTVAQPVSSESPHLSYQGHSDAHIVRGLIAVLFAVYDGKSAQDILKIDPLRLFTELGLAEHLTPQRSNGFVAMTERIRGDAQKAIVE